ncbi:MAG: NUDIX hydrolase [Planctomycetota bacterium]|nr:MAG: NUDIX hydrolase [Planctomycetota bacterium]
MPTLDSHPIVRRGAVAIIVREERCLMIRRAEGIAAPGAYCFPGGGIEPGESEADALCRELREELGVAIEPISRVWESVTPWGVHLAWWTARLAESAELTPSPAEVAEVLWHPWHAMRDLPGLLESNLAFLEALERGDFILAD